jgi:hypothetical protein
MRRVSLLVLMLIGACTSPGPETLVGTWDFKLDDGDAQAVVENFEGLVDSAETVVVRLGFDGADYWQGFLFDGELFLLGGVPEGDGGPYEVEDDRLVMTGAHGEVEAMYRWVVDGDALTLTWVEQCLAPGDCTDDRGRVQVEDPFVFLVMEHTFVRSGNDPAY